MGGVSRYWKNPIFGLFQMRTTISHGHPDIPDHNSIVGEDLCSIMNWQNMFGITKAFSIVNSCMAFYSHVLSCLFFLVQCFFALYLRLYLIDKHYTLCTSPVSHCEWPHIFL